MASRVRELVRDVPDFPKKGILFKDITPVLADAQAFAELTEGLAKLVPEGTTKLAAVESRGFLLASSMALKLGLGVVLIRKPGKLPSTVISHSYALEYGTDTLQIHVDALNKQDRVCIIDDVLATGGTASASETLCIEAGASVSGFVFMMELALLNGRARVKAPTYSLISY